MAFTTLTNPKTILSLGPNRSILGTIIRPDPVLLKRKGGSNGEVTFNSLLPGAGEPLQPNQGDEQEIFSNWQLDDEEEPLPRGSDIDGDADANSSGKKRKASTELSGGKKVKENGAVRRIRSGSRKGNGSKRKRWRDKRDAANGFSRHAWGN